MQNLYGHFSRCFTDVCYWIFCEIYFVKSCLCFLVVAIPIGADYIFYCFTGVDKFYIKVDKLFLIIGVTELVGMYLMLSGLLVFIIICRFFDFSSMDLPLALYRKQIEHQRNLSFQCILLLWVGIRSFRFSLRRKCIKSALISQFSEVQFKLRSYAISTIITKAIVQQCSI